jgi:glycerol-3-phosphate acyltransferase PlsY
MFPAIVAIVIAYLLGSVSSSIILAKVRGKPDPRTQGSGNAGATNVLRSSGKQDAVIVLISDGLKGWFAILIARFLGMQDGGLAIAAVAVVAGHIYPVFFQFKGGKGVATYLGALLGISFIGAIVAMVAWIAIAVISKYASLASIIALLAGSFLTLFTNHSSAFLPMLIAALLVIWMHRANIQRLRNGTENKIHF